MRPDCSVAASARSAFDGFFDMTDVVPGLYTLRVSDGGPLAASREVAVDPNGSLLEGLDLVLHRDPENFVPAP